jgi:hypothetical protein
MSALADRWKFMSKAEVDFIPAIQVSSRPPPAQQRRPALHLRRLTRG